MQTTHLNTASDFRYDFFIVSQAVRFGCVSPTHYNVVFDNSGLKPDHMQRLTYKLCHMYYNWQVTSVDQNHTAANSSIILCVAHVFFMALSPYSSGDCPSACTMSVCPQTGLPGWSEHSQGAQHEPG